MHKINYCSFENIQNELESLTSRDFVFIDTNVSNNFVFQSEANVIEVTDPESKKSLESFNNYSEELIEKGIQRTSKVFAIGGGALTDLAGFVASTILRGVSFYSVPTTLLSMVDAAIGGKTGINTKKGKNLIGSFYPATEVFISPEFLKTLPSEEILSGRGEILKYTFLSNKVNNLVKEDAELKEIIQACIEYKIQICEEDLREGGKRKYLNFGHSFGHALEVSKKMPHGIAVANGIYIILKLYNHDLLDEFNLLSKKLNLQERILKDTFSEALEYLNVDKKTVQDFIQVVTIEEVGTPKIFEVKLEELKKSYLNL